MHTIEGVYIFPIVFITTALFIITALNHHDTVISNALQYGLLVEQAAAQESSIYGAKKAHTKSEISDTIYNLLLTKDKPVFCASLSGNTLYLQENTSKNSPTVFFSNYEHCDTIRKETALILQYLKDE